MPSVIRGTDNFDPANMPAIPTVSITAGTIANGGTIPLPSGYTSGQCKYAVWPHSQQALTGGGGNYVTQVNQSTGVVTVYSLNTEYPGTAGYLCIGVK